MNTNPIRKEQENDPGFSKGSVDKAPDALLPSSSVATSAALPALLLELSRKGFVAEEWPSKEEEATPAMRHSPPGTLSPPPSSIPPALVTLCFDLHDFGDLSSPLPVEEEEWEGEGVSQAGEGENGTETRSVILPPERHSSGEGGSSAFDPMQFIRQKCQEGASLEVLTHDLHTLTSVLQEAISIEVEHRVPPSVMHAISVQCCTLRKEIQHSIPFELSEVAHSVEEACDGVQSNLVQVKEKIDAAAIAAAQQYFDGTFLRVMVLYDALAVLDLPFVVPPHVDEDRRVRLPCGGAEGSGEGRDTEMRWEEEEEEEESDDGTEDEGPRMTTGKKEKKKKRSLHMGEEEGNWGERPFPFAPPPPPPTGGTESKDAFPLSPCSTSHASQTFGLFQRLRTLQRAVSILGVLHETAGGDWDVFRRPEEPIPLQTNTNAAAATTTPLSMSGTDATVVVGGSPPVPSMTSGGSSFASCASFPVQKAAAPHDRDALTVLLAMDGGRAKEAAEALGWCQASEKAILKEMQSVMAEVGRLYFDMVQQDFQRWEKERMEKRHGKEEEAEEEENDVSHGERRENEVPTDNNAKKGHRGGSRDAAVHRHERGAGGVPAVKNPLTGRSSSPTDLRRPSRSFLSLVTSSSSMTSLSGSLLLMQAVSSLYATLQATSAFVEVCQRDVVAPFLQRYVSWTAATQTLHHVDATLSLLHGVGVAVTCYLTPLLTIWRSVFASPWEDGPLPAAMGVATPPPPSTTTTHHATSGEDETKKKSWQASLSCSSTTIPTTSSPMRLFPVADIVWPAVCAVLQEKLHRSLFDTNPPASFRRKYVAATSLEQKILDLCRVLPGTPMRLDHHHHHHNGGDDRTMTTMQGWEERERIRCSPITAEWRRKWRVDIYATECVRRAASHMQEERTSCEGALGSALEASLAYVQTLLHASSNPSLLPGTTTAPNGGGGHPPFHASSSSTVSSIASMETERSGASAPLRGTPSVLDTPPPPPPPKDRPIGGGRATALIECWSGALDGLHAFWRSLRAMWGQFFSHAFLPSATSVFLRQCLSSSYAIAAGLHHQVGEPILSALTSSSFAALAWGTALPAVTAFATHGVLTTRSDTHGGKTTMLHSRKRNEGESTEAVGAPLAPPPSFFPPFHPEEYHNVFLLTLFALVSILQDVRFVSSFLSPSGDAGRWVREAIAGPEEEKEEKGASSSSGSTKVHPTAVSVVVGTAGVPIAVQCVSLVTWSGHRILRDHYTPLLERLTETVMIPACVLPLQHIRSVRATFSHTQKEIPSTPSWYVSSVWQPCVVFRRALDVQQEHLCRSPTPCALFPSSAAPAWCGTSAEPSTTPTASSSSVEVSPAFHAAIRQFRLDSLHVLHRTQLAVLQRFMDATHDTLEAARKADEGWEKLRRRREATAAAAVASNASIRGGEEVPTGQGESVSASASPSASSSAMRLFDTSAAAFSGSSDRDKMMVQLYLDAKEIIQKFALLTSPLSMSTSSWSSIEKGNGGEGYEDGTLERYLAVQNEVREKETELLAMLQRGQSVLEEKMGGG